MKYIKTYKKKDKASIILEVWKIPYKLPHTEIATQKLGAELENSHLYNSKGEKRYKGSFIYFIREIDINWNIISWFVDASFENIKLNAKFQNLELDYKGELEISQKDIEEYNLKKDVNKYNL